MLPVMPKFDALILLSIVGGLYIENALIFLLFDSWFVVRNASSDAIWFVVYAQFGELVVATFAQDFGLSMSICQCN